ncbi:MAG: hypothetical protein H7832_02770 [Magnetococcus sp. DMHC-6]
MVESKSLDNVFKIQMNMQTVIYSIDVDLDDRAFFFPDGKQMTQIKFAILANHEVQVNAVYAFNESHSAPELFRLSLADARELARTLVEAVYRAQTRNVFSETIRMTIHVVPNGYILQIGDINNERQIMLSTSVIWRICHALLRIVDRLSPVFTH